MEKFDFDGKNENLEKIKDFDNINSSVEQKHIDAEIKKVEENKSRTKFIAGAAAVVAVAGLIYGLCIAFDIGGGKDREIKDLQSKINALGKNVSLKESEISSLRVTIGDLEKSGRVDKSKIEELKRKLNELENNKLTNSRSTIKYTSESSALNEEGYISNAKLLVDGDLTTCWAEAVSGYGIGENAILMYSAPWKMNGFKIWNGFQKSNALFYKNSRPSSLRVIGYKNNDVVYNAVHKIADVMGSQTIELNHPVVLDKIQFVINGIYPGTSWRDTSISEIQCF